jgi:hypothetical protein
MAVGGVGRGGRGGGVKGPSGAGGAGKAGSTFKVTGNEGAGKAESLVGPSRAAGADPVTASLSQIAKDLASGAIASKSEATQKAVHTILEKKGLLGKNPKGNKRMVQQIADTLEDDPRLAAALERTWNRAGQK